MCALNLEQVVQRSIEFIRNRHHPEKPHISVLAPPHPRDYWLIWRRPAGFEGAYDEIGDEDEILEDLEEALRSRSPGWIFGSDFELEEGEGGWRAEVRFSFYVRVKPDFDNEHLWDESAYTRADLRLEYWCSAKEVYGEVVFESRGRALLKERIRAPAQTGFSAIVIIPQDAIGHLNQDGLKEVLKRVASIGLRGVVSSIDLKFVPVGGALTADVYDGKGTYIGAYHHAFCALLGHQENLFKAYLINLGGAPETQEHKWLRSAYERPFSVYTYNAGDRSSRWALGYLLEVEGLIKFIGRRPRTRWSGYGLSGAHPISTLIVEGQAGWEFLLRDYYVASELLTPIKMAQQPASNFLARLAQMICGGPPSRDIAAFMSALSRALADAGVQRLYTYQEQATEEVLASLGLISGQQRKAIAVVARTAGGKTLSFLVPILISIFVGKVRGAGTGVKAILTYPTKALANDQVEEVAHLLFSLKKRMEEEGLRFDVSFGYLHGNTYDIKEVGNILRDHRKPYLPVKCLLHEESVYLEDCGAAARARCPSDERCPFASFLNEWMRKTREETYFSPPDILITDEDMINRIISGAPRAHEGAANRAPWYEWQLLGYPYVRCKSCLHTYPPAMSARICKVCRADSKGAFERVAGLSRPRVVVLDEAHQIHGSFGVQVHHMLSLLEQVLGAQPLYVLSSATLGDASKFASSLLGLGTDEVKVVEAEVEAGFSERYFRRVFAFVMPKAYTRDATALRLLGRFCGEFRKEAGRAPKGIIFTNILPENNELVQSLKDELGGAIKVDGHSTDYDRERAKKELDFKGGKIDVFVATSTLELGIDYGVIDFVAIYGMPARISSFVQRMGRAGRNRDAAVFVIFDPDSPMNYSYYESYKILCDGGLRNEAMAHEIILISPMNEEAVRRAVKRWAVSLIHRICAGSSSLWKVLIDDLDAGLRRSAWANIAGRITSAATNIAALPKSLGRLYANFSSYRQVIEYEARKIEREIINAGNSLRGISDLIRRCLREEALYNLRAADEDVLITYPLNVEDNQRRRELRYAVKHCLPGQVTSYRGLFFAAHMEERDQETLERWLGERT
ncbi:MAG: DEAD/DEAH box helicase [Nitrososphaerota archaeon]